MSEYAKDVLVEPEWLEQHLDDDSIRIVEVDENPALYREAHIPGAIGFDWREDLQDHVRRDFLGPWDFGKLFGGRGISNDHLVIVYGDRNNWFAAYTYWYLKYYGHDNVKLLNGPRERWASDGRPTTSELPGHAASTFAAKPGDDSIRAMRDEVQAALEQSKQLVDVRSPQEFSGELVAMPGYENEGALGPATSPAPSRSRGGRRSTRTDVQASRRAARAVRRKGVLTGEPIIAYCRIGERSAHTWFVLHELLGEQDVKNYDGSWTEWGNLVNVPIEKN